MSASSSSSHSSGVPGVPVSSVSLCARCTFPLSPQFHLTLLPISSCYPLIMSVQRVGAVRCYWALLKPRYDPNPDPGITVPQLELEFVHFDPILDAHLSKQKGSMMARSVLEFIHPHERERE